MKSASKQAQLSYRYLNVTRKIVIDDMCKAMGIDTIEKHLEGIECNCHFVGDEVWDPYKRDYFLAESDYICEACSFDYQGKVESYFNTLLERHNLTLINHEDGTYSVEPIKCGWSKVVKNLTETISGYGMFEFASVKEAVSSGPYKSAQDFVYDHLHWVPKYLEVYEGSNPSHCFQRYAFGR